MPTAIDNLVRRTFYLYTSISGSNGTIFAIEVERQQFWITAKHLVQHLLEGETVRLLDNEGVVHISSIQGLAVSEGNPDEDGADMAVLKLSPRINLPLPVPLLGNKDDLFLTQRIAMISGENWPDYGATLGTVVRSGSIAKLVPEGQRNSASGEFVVDVQAYPGFSGSPIIYWDSSGQARIAGVAARFTRRVHNMFGTHSLHTGLIGCYHIADALNLISSME